MTRVIADFFTKNPVQYLATVDEQGNPRVRPVMFAIEKNDKLYFSTSNKKDMFRQMKAHPKIEITTASPEFVWMRISATAVFSHDMEIKKAIIDTCESIRGIYKTADNPDFEIFSLNNGTATLADFSGQPPKTCTF